MLLLFNYYNNIFILGNEDIIESNKTVFAAIKTTERVLNPLLLQSFHDFVIFKEDEWIGEDVFIKCYWKNISTDLPNSTLRITSLNDEDKKNVKKTNIK